MTHRHRTTRARSAAASLAAALTVGAIGCGTDVPAGLIEEETFVQTYVDLRIAALDTDSQRISEEDRRAVLERNGVTADDLNRFAEFHAPDLDFMRGVWNEVELRLDRDTEPN